MDNVKDTDMDGDRIKEIGISMDHPNILRRLKCRLDRKRSVMMLGLLEEHFDLRKDRILGERERERKR